MVLHSLAYMWHVYGPDTLETEYLEGAGLSNAHKESNLPNTAAF